MEGKLENKQPNRVHGPQKARGPKFQAIWEERVVGEALSKNEWVFSESWLLGRDGLEARDDPDCEQHIIGVPKQVQPGEGVPQEGVGAEGKEAKEKWDELSI